MPVVISLLNAFTGTAVAMAGFVLENTTLIIAGALVGASGTILTRLMAAAMNRSVLNIMVGGFGTGDSAGKLAAGPDTQVRAVTADDVAIQLGYAAKVIIVPGYGLAAAQAQHELNQNPSSGPGAGETVVVTDRGWADSPAGGERAADRSCREGHGRSDPRPGTRDRQPSGGACGGPGSGARPLIYFDSSALLKFVKQERSPMRRGAGGRGFLRVPNCSPANSRDWRSAVPCCGR